ncbi:MAG: hypothetical protein IT204_10810 [Fimbriimonadaceae bacterium]|nr:hypothetical protein [Fimbriimonadaceae bacterium]
MDPWIADCTALGEHRLALIGSFTSAADWQQRWPAPQHDWPFEWGTCWKACFVLPVPDFAAEVGFFIDLLGCAVNAAWEDHVMLMSPDGAFTFTLTRGQPGALPPGLRLELMLGNLTAAAAALAARGVPHQPLGAPWGEDSPMRTCELLSPSGLPLQLWGFVT